MKTKQSKTKNLKFSSIVVARTFNPRIVGQSKQISFEFETSLLYRASSRTDKETLLVGVKKEKKIEDEQQTRQKYLQKAYFDKVIHCLNI